MDTRKRSKSSRISRAIDTLDIVFYDGQDLERALDGGGLLVAFDHVDGDVPDKIKVGNALKEELERVGFKIDWSGTTDQRINIPTIDWKRRYRNG